MRLKYTDNAWKVVAFAHELGRIDGGCVFFQRVFPSTRAAVYTTSHLYTL